MVLLKSFSSKKRARPVSIPSAYLVLGSIRGRVSHYDNFDAYQLSVKILEPYPKSAVNDFGSVQSGPLKVSGRSISAVLSMPRTEMTDGKLVGIRWLRSLDYDAAEGPDSWMGFYPDDLASATPQESEEVAVWCLLIGIGLPAGNRTYPFVQFTTCWF